MTRLVTKVRRCLIRVVNQSIHLFPQIDAIKHQLIHSTKSNAIKNIKNTFF